jgi:hypothetical protein
LKLETNESNSWYILVTLVVSFFIYQCNVIYSVNTTLLCNTYEKYWLQNSGIGSVFELTAAIFLLIGLWSSFELVLAFGNKVSDRKVCFFVNSFIVVGVIASLYSMHELKKSILRFPMIYEERMKHEHTKKNIEFFSEYYCKGTKWSN